MNKLTKLWSKSKRVTSDFILRISSSVLTTFANQIVLLPLLAAVFDAETYGFLLTLISIKNIIAGTLGNSLYSTRLIVNSKYEEENKTGDFNRLIAIATVLGVVVMAVVMVFMDGVTWLTGILLIPVVALYTLNSYLGVWYPVTLQFRKSLVHSIVVSIGTIIGAVIVYLTKVWTLAYLASALAGFLFVTRKTGILKEGFGKTNLMRLTVSKWGILMITTLLVNVVTYLDRLVLYPLLGPEAVSTFSTATYFGKALSVLAMPIAGVMLSYYAQRNFAMTRKRYWVINGACGAMLGLFAVFSLLMGKWVTGLLFPTLIDEAGPYIFIGNLSAALAALVQIVQTAAMKYAKTGWQLVVQIAYLVVYFALGMILIGSFGLMGFCVASLCANAVRLIMQIMIGHFALGGNHEFTEA